VSHLQN
jgi:hypothetical protein